MTTFPDLDTEISGYIALIDTGADGHKMTLPGRHTTFSDAAATARRATQALLRAGFTGMQARVGYSGERPVGFPSTPGGVAV